MGLLILEEGLVYEDKTMSFSAIFCLSAVRVLSNWPIAKAFGDFAVINRGFGGSIMADSVYYADAFTLAMKIN